MVKLEVNKDRRRITVRVEDEITRNQDKSRAAESASHARRAEDQARGARPSRQARSQNRSKSRERSQRWPNGGGQRRGLTVVGPEDTPREQSRTEGKQAQGTADTRTGWEVNTGRQVASRDQARRDHARGAADTGTSNGQHRQARCSKSNAETLMHEAQRTQLKKEVNAGRHAETHMHEAQRTQLEKEVNTGRHAETREGAVQHSSTINTLGQ